MGEQDLMLDEIEGLHAKTIGILGANGINTIQQLADAERADLLAINGVGEKSLNTLMRAVATEMAALTPIEEEVVEKPISPAAPMEQPYPGTYPPQTVETPPVAEVAVEEVEEVVEPVSEPLPEPEEPKEDIVEFFAKADKNSNSVFDSMVKHGFHINPANFGRMDALVVFFLDFLNAIYGEGSGTTFEFNPLDTTQTLARLKLKYPNVFTELQEDAKA